MQDKDKIEHLLTALSPFAEAFKRMRTYGPEPKDTTPLFAVTERNTAFELLNTEEGPALTVEDLNVAFLTIEVITND